MTDGAEARADVCHGTWRVPAEWGATVCPGAGRLHATLLDFLRTRGLIVAKTDARKGTAAPAGANAPWATSDSTV